MGNLYSLVAARNTAPAENAATVTPSDTTDLTVTTRGIMVGGAGNVKVTMAGGQTVVMPGLLAGVLYSLAIKRIWATSTTATNIVAMW